MTRWDVSCDFDGTITVGDLVQGLLSRFASPAWRVIEAEWEAGAIGARDCLERQTELLRATPADLDAWVDAQPVDPDAAAFFDDCRAAGWDVRILSDGYDRVIHRVLGRMGVRDVPVSANRLEPTGGDRWRVSFPLMRRDCPSGVCKCAAAAPPGRRLHVGDGRSDACLADHSERVFATKGLLAERRTRGRPVEGFAAFADLRRRLFPHTSAPLPAHKGGRHAEAPSLARLDP